jgi:hypothetical protein
MSMHPQGEIRMAPANDSALEIRLVPLSSGQWQPPAQALPVSATKIVSHGELEMKASRSAPESCRILAIIGP